MIADRAALTHKTCLSYWFPLIEAAGVPVPQTKILDATDEWHKLAMLCEGKYSPLAQHLAEDICAAATKLGGFPVFLRTGQGNGKHSWSECCCLADPMKVVSHIANLVEWSMNVDFLGLPFRVWAVREMLPTRPLFRCAAYGGFPVVREFRVFVDGGNVLYTVPYWPEGAVAQGKPDDVGWEAKLYLANTMTDGERQEIEHVATMAGDACGGKWSVDVLDVQGRFFVTDMAAAELSYGWRGE